MGFAGIVRHEVSVPVIAAVNGLCLGGGMEIVLAADLAIAAPHARFALPEGKMACTRAAAVPSGSRLRSAKGCHGDSSDRPHG